MQIFKSFVKVDMPLHMLNNVVSNLLQLLYGMMMNGVQQWETAMEQIFTKVSSSQTELCIHKLQH